MSGNLIPPTKFASTSVWNITDLDGDFQAYADYINIRQVTFDILANRPAPGVAGRFYYATDSGGGTTFLDTGTQWLGAGASLAAPAVSMRAVAGFTLSNDIGSPNDTLDVGTGLCASDEINFLVRTFLFRDITLKGTITGTWIFGDNQPKLDAGPAAPNTWYSVFAILNQTVGANDVLFSTSATAPVVPAGYTRKRRIGSFRTDAATHIIPFVQRGDSFSWLTSVLDLNANNPGIAAFSTVLTVPTGVEVQAVTLAGAQNDGNAGAVSLLVSDLATADQAPDTTLMTTGSAVQNLTAGFVRFGLVPLTVWTDTAASVRVRASFSDANVFAIIRTLGWIDRLGQD